MIRLESNRRVCEQYNETIRVTESEAEIAFKLDNGVREN